ncbi:hypothetical protein WKH57_25770 [Niallia taxi]|uniref:DUF4760 domain-containing protein n=1 Tax=Niallia taxi TaxID=2499688 RepID=UPI003181F052
MDWLNKWISTVRPILEMLYFIVNIGLFATVIIGIKQLKLVKDDMKLQYQRAAKEKSIEYLNWFSKELIPQMNKIMSNTNDDDLPKNTGTMNKEFLPNEYHDTKETQDYISKLIDLGASDVLNQLEFFSSALLNGLADEKICFKPMVKTYTSIVAMFYPVICQYRKSDQFYYLNIVELYDIWNKKLQKSNMEIVKNQLEQNMDKLEVRDIKSMGM